MTCRFCSDGAVAVFTLSDGCICYPDDREQALCWHHAMRATPLGGMELRQDLTVGAEFTKWLESQLLGEVVP